MKDKKETEQKEYYFVYGTLKKGFGNSERLFGRSETAKFVKNVETSPKYTMVSLGAFPGVINGGETAIQGELWEVSDEETKINLDHLEGYRGENEPHNLYNKEVIELDDKQVNIYILNRSNIEGMKVVTNGKW